MLRGELRAWRGVAIRLLGPICSRMLASSHSCSRAGTCMWINNDCNLSVYCPCTIHVSSLSENRLGKTRLMVPSFSQKKTVARVCTGMCAVVNPNKIQPVRVLKVRGVAIQMRRHHRCKHRVMVHMKFRAPVWYAYRLRDTS